jgi:hypothetical protein
MDIQHDKKRLLESRVSVMTDAANMIVGDYTKKSRNTNPDYINRTVVIDEEGGDHILTPNMRVESTDTLLFKADNIRAQIDNRPYRLVVDTDDSPGRRPQPSSSGTTEGNSITHGR